MVSYIVKFLRSFIKFFNHNSVCCRLVCTSWAGAIVAGIGVGQSLRICFIVVVIAMRVKARWRCAVTDVKPEKGRGGRSRALRKAGLFRGRSGDNGGRAGGETKRSTRAAYKCHAASRTGSRRVCANAQVGNVPWIRRQRGWENCQVCNCSVVQ